MKNIKYKLGIFLSLILIINSCQEDNYEVGELIAPSNIEMNVLFADGIDDDGEIIFVSEGPGDGTGIVKFEVTSIGAITYRFNFGDNTGIVSAPTGIVTHTFSLTDINPYVVTVLASGRGAVTSTHSKNIEVFSSFEDVEAADFLTGGVIDQGKTWYWSATTDVHVGMGPANDNYGDLDFSWPNWWSGIKAWDEEKGCMYTDEFKFTKTAKGITFEQTVGPAFVPGTYAGYIGVDGDTCHDETVATTMFGVKNVSFSPSTSKAALEGLFKDIPNGNVRVPYRQTTFTISDGGFMGWHVGSSTYDIISITNDNLVVRVEENPATGVGAAWYHVFTTTKPEK